MEIVTTIFLLLSAFVHFLSSTREDAILAIKMRLSAIYLLLVVIIINQVTP